MAVKTHELDNQEKGAALEQRAPARAPVETFPQRAARLLTRNPADSAPHNAAAYRAGWVSALKAAERDGTAAAKAHPEVSGPTPCGDCYRRGWLAAWDALEAEA